MSNWFLYKIMYRLRVHGVETELQLLNMDTDLYTTVIEAPSAQLAMHWRGDVIARALKKIESDVCKVIDLRVVEITREEAAMSHRRVCRKKAGEYCHDCNNFGLPGTEDEPQPEIVYVDR